MGVLDLPKLALKARQMQSKMQNTKAAGKSGNISLIVNGLYSIVDFEADIDEIAKKFKIEDKEMLKKLIAELMNDVKKAQEDAKKHLEKQMAQSSTLDDLKGMLG